MEKYGNHCRKGGLEFQECLSVLSPDESTLFTTSGMQKSKSLYRDMSVRRRTFCDVQRCLRLGDLGEIGDGTHFLDFHMLGLYSLRHWSLGMGVRFWLEFLDSVGVLPDTVTIHPDRPDHRSLYRDVDVRIVEDPGCVWSDGGIGGYCTEMHREGVEIGNIVNPLGDSLDCGFGLERIGSFLPGWGEPPPTRGGVISRTVGLLLGEGVVPGPGKQGYVLRKLIRLGLREGSELPEHPLVERERRSRERMLESLPRLLLRHPGKPRRFFRETFGIDPEEMPPGWPE